MTTEPKVEEDSSEAKPVAVGWVQKLEKQYQKAKEDEHAETRAYVWGSYILVYGVFGLWLTYRGRKLRKTEDRVRVLHDKIRKQFEEESVKSASLTNKPSTSAAKATK